MGDKLYHRERTCIAKAEGELTVSECKISRILCIDCIRLELNAPREWQERLADVEDEDEITLPPLRERREQVIAELVELLLPVGVVQHRGRVYNDLIFRERKASTGLGYGIAVPHVRTRHVRDLAIGFGRTTYPLDWDALDDMPVDLFFVIVAPPFDDRIYNRLWPKLAGILQFEHVREALRKATDPGEVIGIIRREE